MIGQYNQNLVRAEGTARQVLRDECLSKKREKTGKGYEDTYGNYDSD